jgi:2-C-methyl-D-erythritol 4-phosphate cytidylyltransferase
MKEGKRMNNEIPRKFNRITGKMLINTSMDQIGDTLHITKNDISTGYLALNTRTQKYAYCFPSMIRNKDIFELIEII